MKSMFMVIMQCWFLGAGKASWTERRTRDRKVASSNPGRSGGRNFFSSPLCVLTLIRRPFHPCVTAVARKRSRSFCQKCRWLVIPKYACTLDPTKSEWADYAAVYALCGHPAGKELTRNSSRNTRPQSSQLAEHLWTNPGLKSGISKSAEKVTIVHIPGERCATKKKQKNKKTDNKQQQQNSQISINTATKNQHTHIHIHTHVIYAPVT